MTPPVAEQERRPVARLRLRRAAVVPRDRAPVFHLFEEMFARSADRRTPDQAKGDRG